MMLLAAYTGQFTGDEPQPWHEWAEARGHSRTEARRPQEDLRRRNLVIPTGGA
jgi:hypothetical protein